MSPGHSLESFVKTVLLKDIHRMTYDCGLHYLAFGTIAVGIEFLGACEDAHPFEQPGESRRRFKLGIERYMALVEPRYATYNDRNSPFFLYKHLRCGMAHIMRPQGTVGFICRSDAQKAGHAHLSLVNGGQALLLTAEDFYDDFAKACQLLLANLPAKTDSKLKSIYLPVSELSPLASVTASTVPLSGA
jgi:hypothetical protein